MSKTSKVPPQRTAHGAIRKARRAAECGAQALRSAAVAARHAAGSEEMPGKSQVPLYQTFMPCRCPSTTLAVVRQRTATRNHKCRNSSIAGRCCSAKKAGGACCVARSVAPVNQRSLHVSNRRPPRPVGRARKMEGEAMVCNRCAGGGLAVGQARTSPFSRRTRQRGEGRRGGGVIIEQRQRPCYRSRN